MSVPKGYKFSKEHGEEMISESGAEKGSGFSYLSGNCLLSLCHRLALRNYGQPNQKKTAEKEAVEKL